MINYLLNYKIQHIEYKVKDEGQPASLYFKIGLYPEKFDEFNIKKEISYMNLMLDDILLLKKWDERTMQSIKYYMKLEPMPYEQWRERALILYNDIYKHLIRKNIKLLFNIGIDEDIKKNELSFFECLNCKKHFGTLRWSWVNKEDNYKICDIACPYCGTSSIMDSSIDKTAFGFMQYYHGTQKRAHGTPYFTHPAEVYRFLIDNCPVALPDYIRAAALLHDVVEDTSVQIEEIEKKFGKNTADAVYSLTKTNFKNKDDYYRNLKEQDDLIKIVKVADRVHNLSELPLTKDPERIARYEEDTTKYIIYIAQSIKNKELMEWATTILNKSIILLNR